MSNPYPPQNPFSQQSQIPTQGVGGFGIPPKQAGGQPPEKDYLAPRFNRLVAHIIDGLIVGIAAVVITFVIVFAMLGVANGGDALEEMDENSPVFVIVTTLFGYVLWLVINGFSLVSEGQSLGKKCMGIQIVDANSGMLLPFVRVCVIRVLWSLPFMLVVALVPGDLDDFAFNVFAGIGVLLIFGGQRKCFHDHLAGSIVVEYRPGRAHA